MGVRLCLLFVYRYSFLKVQFCINSFVLIKGFDTSLRQTLYKVSVFLDIAVYDYYLVTFCSNKQVSLRQNCWLIKNAGGSTMTLFHKCKHYAEPAAVNY